MTTQPENEPDHKPIMPEAVEVQAQLSQAIDEEGGATKENLVLSVYGYGMRALDHVATYFQQHNLLGLSPDHLKILSLVLTDVGVMAAKQAAIRAKRGEDLTEWATITEEEATGIAVAQLESMISNTVIRSTALEGSIEPEAPKTDESAS